jgi:ATP-dependent DNA helicase RecG
MLSKQPSAKTLSRLNTLVQSHDGFEIAQKDLEMRGQGELMGTKQSGSGELDFAEMFREPELLVAAKKEADTLVATDPTLSRPENRFLRVNFSQKY